MTVKEIEVRSGMTRANIRFYESEGLFRPRRLENGYRDYSEEDLALLMRVRLLRALGVSLDEIRALQGGEEVLDDALRRRLEEMETEQAQLASARAVCQTLRAEGTSFDALDAPRFLALLDSAAAPAADAMPQVPWRRYWARCFDLSLYRSVLIAAAALGFHAVSPVTGLSWPLSILIWALSVVLMIVFEPIFLSRFGTTPGKWLLGLRVTDPEGRLLSRSEVYTRTVDVLLYGMALSIPFLSMISEFRSLRRSESNEPQPWEDGSAVVARDTKNWRYINYALSALVLGGLMTLACLLSWQMPNRGELTAAEFCENYNRAVKLYDPDARFRLREDGTWEKTESGTIYIGPEGEELSPPVLVFELRDGVVTGVSFELDGTAFLDYRSIEACLVCAFAGARREAGLTGLEVRQAMDRLRRQFLQTTDTVVCGVYVQNRAEEYTKMVPTLTFPSASDIDKFMSGASGEADYTTEEMPQSRIHVAFSMQLIG